eukprot:1255809-Pleurochrysis_carterae.AAC.2
MVEEKKRGQTTEKDSVVMRKEEKPGKTGKGGRGEREVGGDSGAKEANDGGKKARKRERWRTRER